MAEKIENRPALTFRRKLGTIPFEAGATKTLELPRDRLYREIGMRLSGSLTIGVAAATAFAEDQAYTLIKKLRVIANGKDVIKSHNFKFLRHLNHIDYGTPPQTVPVSSLATGTYAFNAYAKLPLWMPRSISPRDTLFNSQNLSTFTFECDYGAATDLVLPAGTTTLALTNTNLELTGYEQDNFTGNFVVSRHSTIQQEVTATTDRFQIDIPVGNFYRRFSIFTTIVDANGFEQRTNGILNNVTLESGTLVYVNQRASDLQDTVKQDYQLESYPTGVYVVEFAQDGRLVESLDATKLSSLRFIMDVNKVGATSNKIHIIPNELIFPAA